MNNVYNRCVPGQHPRLRWSRRRRSIMMDRYREKLLGARSAFLYRRRRRALYKQQKYISTAHHQKWNRFLRNHFPKHRGRRSPKMGASTSVRQPANNLKNLRRNNGENRRNKGRKKGVIGGMEKVSVIFMKI